MWKGFLEIKESIKILRQCFNNIPDGDVHEGLPKKIRPKKEVNNKVFDSLSKLKKRDIIERYKQEEQESLERVEWSENPYYEN